MPGNLYSAISSRVSIAHLFAGHGLRSLKNSWRGSSDFIVTLGPLQQMNTLHQVKQNLLFYTLWTEVHEISLPGGTVLSGKPHNKLLGDDMEQGLEIVLPARIGEEVTPKRLNTIFNDMQQAQGTRPKRLIIGIVNDDSTVVYYFIHDGLVKPKKN